MEAIATTKTEQYLMDNFDGLYYHNLEDAYEKMLDDIYGDVDICGMKYSSGRALKELDPIAFRCGLLDWMSEEYTDEMPNEKYYTLEDEVLAEAATAFDEEDS